MDNCVTTKVESSGDEWTVVVRGADWEHRYPVAEAEKNREKLIEQVEEERVQESLRTAGWVEQDEETGAYPMLKMTPLRLPAGEGTAWTWKEYSVTADGEPSPEDAYTLRHEQRVRNTVAAALRGVGASSEPTQQDCAAAALLLELDCAGLLGGQRRAEAFSELNGGWWTQGDGPAYRTAAQLALVLLRADAGAWEEASHASTFTVCELVANYPLGESALLAYAWLQRARERAAERGAAGTQDAREALHALRCAVSHDPELDAGPTQGLARVPPLDAWLPDWRDVAGKRLDHSGAALLAARQPA